ncbi:hypothetical protein GCM10007036_36370 [Alsobacter metallidurans]|uniref:Protein NO VEIN C-terminal domain-containing protein n=1 Tax=Alsobacter metallidurans TaxID=340221 RepID=A0A917ML44_9HYPH|nr:DUF3883 domain-containing protein [Alsobacter metallidurans]GGH27680.1 hypothetical protein GCM10007036_36370 [Alsobacter metallidurans]
MEKIPQRELLYAWRDLPFLGQFESCLALYGMSGSWRRANVGSWRFDGVPPAPQTNERKIRDLEVAPPLPHIAAKVQRERSAARVNFAGRDERNRRLGRAGEEWAVGVLKSELLAAGRADLAEKVIWVSANVGDGLGYDIAGFDPAGRPLAIKVKTTNGNHGAPFIVAANEVRAYEEEPTFVLMRIFDFSDKPRFYRLHGPSRRSCALTPLAFGAHSSGI